MFKNLVFYTVAGSIFWFIAQKLGAGMGVSLAASLLLPPVFLIGWMFYKYRRPLM